MKCMICGCKLVEFYFLKNNNEKRQFYSGAELVGFSNVKGLRCVSDKCRQTFVQEDVRIFQVKAVGRHDYREDLGEEGDIWEIVDTWIALNHYR